jgi:membrane fusion protein, multidrug efflux system
LRKGFLTGNCLIDAVFCRLFIKLMLNRFYAIFLFSLLLVACSGKKEEQAGPGGGGGGKKPAGNAIYEAVIVQKFPISRSIQTPGTVLPNEIAELHPEVSNRITGIFFQEGQYVRKGQLLVKLYDADLQAQVKKLNVQLRLAQSANQRQVELLAISGTSKQEAETAELTVSNTQADIALLKVEIGKTEIHAPFDGRMGLRLVSPGAYVTPASVITSIAAVSQTKVEFDVPEVYVTELPTGKTVSFTLDGNPKTYFAAVLASDNSISANTRNLKVRAVVKNGDAAVKPGAFAEVKLNIGENTPALMVPTQAVIPQTRGKQIVVVRRGMAVFQDVQTGYRDSANVEIQTGLQDGDTVLTSGLLVIKPNQKVKVRVAGSTKQVSDSTAKQTEVE